MITKNTFKELLENKGFKQENNIYEKSYNEYNCTMKVDFKNQKLIYPEKIEGRERNTTFEDSENFVVFECVDHLLTKGYRPEHIELEKIWTLGHTQKGGRADICVYNENKSEMLLIIECKTAGREYQKALKDTLYDGGQLFSYWQQERSTKWLALYTSDYQDGEIKYNCSVINCSDDANIKELAKKDSSVRLYEKAYTAEEKYEVWKETYSNKIYDNLIFGKDTMAYKIGVKPLYKIDLKDFKPEDKIVNRFEEILRHNNVSDKENAFNKLIVLFICKLVDEISKDDNDIMDFQYKQGTDTYESLQDRLQKLHQKGMEEFMKEKIFYVESDYAERLFEQYTGVQRKSAIEELNQTIRILKFYSNNDFTFKDVHNEELFYQNGKALVEVVQLFEQYRIVYPSKHQFLGDLFEQLLNKGFKQNEGQFFTPIPITRFIWDSLPLEKIMHKDDRYKFPKVIDYACGAGHFLTEAIESINSYYNLKSNESIKNNNSWVEKNIFGIEKDYRLARVSKVSMFMNGAGDSNIIFGDGLENYPEKGIMQNEFDILVANPPYSVSAFKSHLQLKNNKFELTSRISNDGSEIETLFVERIAQLLKPGGVAAVILPASILSNNSNSSYMGAREQILKHFYVRAITCFANKTFGATGTNTVVLFLEKREEPPVRFKLVEDTANAILNNDIQSDWEDNEIFLSYLNQIEVDEETYRKFIEQSEYYKYFEKSNYFVQYIKNFLNQQFVKNKMNQTTFKKLSEEEKNRWYNQNFYAFTREKEKEKIKYFAMVYNQSTLIITAPSDNVEQKNFLGYDWSNRKGNEGIVINKPGGKMYNPSDRYDENTLAGLIRGTFYNKIGNLNKDMEKYYRYANLKDMIDFSRYEFDKSIKTTVSQKKIIKSKYPLEPLGNVVDVRIGGTPSRNNMEYFTGKNLWVSISEMNGQEIEDTKEKITDEAVKKSNVKLIPKGTTLLSFKLSIGKTAIAGKDLYTNEAIAGLIPLNDNITNEYLYALFSAHIIDLENVGDKAFGKSLNSAYLRNEVMIPIPPHEIQRVIVEKCEEINRKYQKTEKEIQKNKEKIENLFENSIKEAKEQIKLNSNLFELGIGKRVLKMQLSENGIPVYSANVHESFGKINDEILQDYNEPSVIWGIDGDWDVNYIEANKPFYPTDHCGILRVKDSKKINPYYISFALRKVGKEARFDRSNRASIDRISSLRIEVPDISVQNLFEQNVKIINDKINYLTNELIDINSKRKEILEKYL